MTSRGDHPGLSEGTLNAMAKAPIRNGRGEDVQTRRQRQKLGGAATAGGMKAQSHEKPGAVRHRGLPQPPEGARLTHALISGLFASRTVREYIPLF